MFNFFANIFGYLLNFIYNFVNNYGLAIIIFTILLKGIMLPISIKQQKTMKKNTEMQKKVKEIEAKYGNDKVRQSEELMNLYKRENMSPFSGCLTSIVQIIIVLSMFYLVSRPLTYMKHIDPEIIDNYAQTIVENGGNANYKEIAVIKEMSDKDESVRINMNFFGLDLSDIPSQNYTNWKVYIIPALYVITSIFSTKLTMNMNKIDKKDENNMKVEEKKESQSDNNTEKNKDNADDAMEEMNKQMSLMMPIMTVSIACIAPLGLALYWLVSNILMIGERLIINKFFKDDEKQVV